MADELVISRSNWLGLMAELRRRGGGRTESGAFLLGQREGERRIFQTAAFYDDLDPDAYSTGLYWLGPIGLPLSENRGRPQSPLIRGIPLES